MLAPRAEGRIDEAQAAWGAGIVAIGAASTAAGDYTAVAQNHLDTLYGYKDGFDELFKPTKAKEVPFEVSFRPTEEETHGRGGTADGPARVKILGVVSADCH